MYLVSESLALKKIFFRKTQFPFLSSIRAVTSPSHVTRALSIERRRRSKTNVFSISSRGTTVNDDWHCRVSASHARSCRSNRTLIGARCTSATRRKTYRTVRSNHARPASRRPQQSPPIAMVVLVLQDPISSSINSSQTCGQTRPSRFPEQMTRICSMSVLMQGIVSGLYTSFRELHQ